MQAVRSIPAAALAPRVNNNNTARRPSAGIVSLRRRTGAVVPAASAEKDGAKVDYKSDEFTVLPDAPVKDLVPIRPVENHRRRRVRPEGLQSRRVQGETPRVRQEPSRLLPHRRGQTGRSSEESSPRTE
jgi:hypothetical protein